MSPEDFLKRAEVRASADDLHGAIDDCTEAIRLDPLNSAAYTKRGLYLDDPIISDDRAEAIADFTKAIELDPQNNEAYWRRALIYEWDRRNFGAAIADLTEAIRILPHSGLYLSRGFCYWRLDLNEEAIADFTWVIENDTDKDANVDGYVRRARSRHEIGDSIGALADMEAALQLATYPSVYEQRGDISYDVGDLDGALSDYNRVIELGRAGAETFNSRAWLLYQKKDYAPALMDADRAIEIDSAWEYLHTRGMIYAAQGNVLRAVSDFESALALNPDVAEEIEMRAYITASGIAPDQL